MKSLMPWVCLVTVCGVQTSFADEGIDAYRQGDYIKAAEAFNTRSKSDPIIEYYMGRMNLYGYGQLKNNALALKHLKNAAEKGHLKAQNILARYELLVANDPKAALHWFEKAADEGDIQAQMYSAAAYMFGYGTKENPAKARRYYIAAAKNGNTIAQVTLADYFLDSRNRQNQKLGLIWLNKAAESGNAQAKLKQGIILSEGKYTTKDLEGAKKLFESLISEGSEAAMYQMGLLEQQQGQVNQAKEWFEKSAEKGFVPAQIALSKLFFQKDGPFYKPESGFLIILKAAQKNSTEAQAILSNLYKEGVGVAKDDNLAKEWQEKSTAQNKPTKQTPEVEVARWLSEDKSDQFSDSGYLLEGIFSPWKNSQALKENNYNQSPQIISVTREQLYKPDFTLADPNDVLLSEYYNAIASSYNPLADEEIKLPVYSLKSVQSIEQDDPTLPNSPTLSVSRMNQNYLPAGPTLSTIDVFDFMSRVDQDKNQQSIFQKNILQAILGNPNAQFKLGQMYDYGISVESNPEKAQEYYQLAADQYDLRAQYNLATMFLEGRGVKRDTDKAESLLKEAAFKGNARAQYALARIKEQGLRNANGELLVDRDSNESITMYYLAASNDYGLAQHRLAEILVRQKADDMSVSAVKKRNRMIKKLYQGAVAQGIHEAALPLAYFDAMDGDRKKQAKAFAIAKREAQQGNPQGALLAGLMLDRGLGVEANASEAIYWYQKTTNNPVGAFILGTYLTKGDKISRDEATGKTLLQRSADAGFSYGNLNLAIVKHQQNESFLPELDAARAVGNSKAGLLLADYYLSLGNDPEKMTQARRIYENFAKKGDKNAQLKLAFMNEQGLGGAIDFAAAKDWYTKAAAQHDDKAKYFLARLNFLGKLSPTPDYAQAKSLLKNSAATYPPAAVALGYIYDTVDDNYRQALTAYKIAANTNDSIGLYNLGLMYEQGKGVPVNIKMAESLYNKAAEQGHPQAMVQLAGLYFDGQHGSQDEAYDWYIKAAEKGDHEALYQLGLMSETGVSATMDMPMAVNYYQKSAEKGNTKAKLALARIHQYGQGVGKDKQKAFEIYEQLASENNPYAQFQLATLYYEGFGDHAPQPKKGRALLVQSEANGNKQASKVLQWLDAQNQERLSYIEPAAFHQGSEVVQQPAELMFLDAMNEWNRGDELLSRLILDKLLIQFPHFTPAKRAFEQLEQPLLSRKFS